MVPVHGEPVWSDLSSENLSQLDSGQADLSSLLECCEVGVRTHLRAEAFGQLSAMAVIL